MSKYILIVEDDKFLSDIYQNQYQKEGFETEVAINGLEALVSIKKRKPDLITLDMIMPGMNGFDFLEVLRKDNYFDDVPVIILTNLSQPEDRRRCQEIGKCTYLVKTETDLDQLSAVIKEKLV